MLPVATLSKHSPDGLPVLAYRREFFTGRVCSNAFLESAVLVSMKQLTRQIGHTRNPLLFSTGNEKVEPGRSGRCVRSAPLPR